MKGGNWSKICKKKQIRKRNVPKWLDHYVGSGEVEGELSSVAGEEIVDEIPGSGGGHSQEDEGSLADAESTSDTLAYAGGIGQKYVKKSETEREGTKMVGSLCLG